MKTTSPLSIISPTAGDTITHVVEETEAQKEARDEAMSLGIHRLPDGSADLSDPRNRKHFDDLEYALHHPDEPLSLEYGPTAAEIEETKRREIQLLDALKEQTSARLLTQGLYADAAWVRHDGEGYSVRFRDAQKRIFEVHILFEQDVFPFASEDVTRNMIERCCERALAERERYFRRMQ